MANIIMVSLRRTCFLEKVFISGLRMNTSLGIFNWVKKYMVDFKVKSNIKVISKITKGMELVLAFILLDKFTLENGSMGRSMDQAQ